MPAVGEVEPRVERLADIEQREILHAYRTLGYTDACRALGIGKTTLYRKLKLYRQAGLAVEGEPVRRRRHVYVSAERLKPLLEEARAAAVYLQRCVGTAKIMGEALGREVDKLTIF
jgi:transposase